MDITISLTDNEVKCLENDLLDIQEWVEQAVRNKVESCKSRLVQEWVPKLMNDESVATIPANESELISAIMVREDYKTRVQRKLEEDNKQRGA